MSDGLMRGRSALSSARQEGLEEATYFNSGHVRETTARNLSQHHVLSQRLPASGNAALGASALIQAALGVEFTLSGLNKLAERDYVANFNAFVRSTPGATSGILSSAVRTLVLPNIGILARLIEVTELLVGVILLIGAVEIGRRRFAGPLGAQHGYEAPVALVSGLAGLIVAGLAFSIGLLLGEGLPTITPGRAFTTAIPVELLIVPLGVAIAWLEFGRFLILRRSPAAPPVVPVRLDQQPKGPNHGLETSDDGTAGILCHPPCGSFLEARRSRPRLLTGHLCGTPNESTQEGGTQK